MEQYQLAFQARTVKNTIRSREFKFHGDDKRDFSEFKTRRTL